MNRCVALAALGLATVGPAASAGQPERGTVGTTATATATQGPRHQRADVQLSVTDPAGRSIAATSMPPSERERVATLQSSLQQWGNQQSQRVSVTIHCTYPPLRCDITITFG